jgi:hypothetical protein
MAQLIVAQEAGVLSDERVQLALLVGGGALAYYWYQSNYGEDAPQCIVGLGSGAGGDLIKGLCDTVDGAKNAALDGLEYTAALPDRLKVASSGNPYEQGELALDLKESGNVFDDAVVAVGDFFGVGISEVAEATKVVNEAIEATQPDPETTRLMMARHFDWMNKLKDNVWFNTEALKYTNFSTNYDMAIDVLREKIETETGGELKLEEVPSEFASQGGRTLVLTAYSEAQGKRVRVGNPFPITTGWFGLLKVYYESVVGRRYFQNIPREEQRAYILSTYGKGEHPLVLWGSGVSVPAFLQYYQIKYDMNLQHLVPDNITFGDTTPPMMF